jgi:hypothetical protein
MYAYAVLSDVLVNTASPAEASTDTAEPLRPRSPAAPSSSPPPDPPRESDISTPLANPSASPQSPSTRYIRVQYHPHARRQDDIIPVDETPPAGALNEHALRFRSRRFLDATHGHLFELALTPRLLASQFVRE